MEDEEYQCEKECGYSAPLSEYTELYGGWYECPRCGMTCKFVDIPVENEFKIEFTPDASLLRNENEPIDIYLFRQALLTTWDIFIERREQYGNHMKKGAKYAFDGIDTKYSRIKHMEKKVTTDTLIDMMGYAGMAWTFREVDNNLEDD